MKTQLALTSGKTKSLGRALQLCALSMVGLILFAALPGRAHATDISFTYGLDCNGLINKCPISNLNIPYGLGGKASDNVTIKDVNGLAITGGNLTFTSPGATSSFSDPPGVIDKFDDPGGSFAITGMVPGLTSPTTLLSGFFLAGGKGDFHTWGEMFQSPIDVTFVDPTMLADLGMSNSTPYGWGNLSDAVYYSGSEDIWSVTVTYSPSPEPGSLVLFGSGIVGIGGMLRRRFRRDA